MRLGVNEGVEEAVDQVEQQHAKGDIQGSDNWFKVMDFFQAIHNAYFLLSVHLSDNEILSQREEALYNQNKTPD